MHGSHPGGGVPPRPWTWLEQCHGAGVVVVEHPGHHAGASADAAVTAVPGAALVVRAADCAPVALLAPQAVGLAHVGWRGLVAGVLEATLEAMGRIGAGPVEARIGPCIGPASYEFGAADLDTVASRYGDVVRSRTDQGSAALHLAAGVDAALRDAGVLVIEGPVGCTATEPERWFSHRARGDSGRHAAFAWLDGERREDGEASSAPGLR